MKEELELNTENLRTQSGLGEKAFQAEGTASAMALRWMRKKKLLSYGTGGGWSGGRNQAAWGFMAVQRIFLRTVGHG